MRLLHGLARLAIQLCIAAVPPPPAPSGWQQRRHGSDDWCVAAAAVTFTNATIAFTLTCVIATASTGFSRAVTAAGIPTAPAGFSRVVTAPLGRGWPRRGHPLAATAALALAVSATGRNIVGRQSGESDRGRA